MKRERNILLSHRLEHGANPKKTKFTENSRDNYNKFADSDIFASKNCNRSLDDRFTAYNTNNQFYNIFNPKFKDETAISRKLKEFYNLSAVDFNENYKSVSTHKESSIKNIENINPKEMKLKELYPNISRDSMKKCSQIIRVNKYLNKNPENERISVKSFKNNYSNIFNDPHKDENALIENIIKKESKPLLTKQCSTVVDIKKIYKKPNSKLESHFDWKKTNTEIAFNDTNMAMYESNSCKIKSRNYSSVAERQKTVQNLSSKMMKLNNLTSSFDNDKSINDRKYEIMRNDTEKRETMAIIVEEKPKILSHKLKKTFENMGSLHPPDFYNAIETNTNNINVETYQIDDVRKIKDLGEFKSTFSKNGIHIYNIEEFGIEKYNAAVRLTFKIRKQIEKSGENKKIDDIFKQFNSKGVKINPKLENLNKNKKASSLIPSSVKWNNPQVEKYVNNNKNFIQKMEPPRSALRSEKLSNKFPLTDTSYKNNFGLKK